MKAMVPPDPGACGRISFQELEYSEQGISPGTGSYSADIGGRTSSRGQHPWPDQATQTWRTRASEKYALQGARDHVEPGTVDDKEKKEPEAAEIRRTGGHITEDRGSQKGDGDQGEGGIGDHGLNERESGLQGRESGKIKTGGREIERNCKENRHSRV